MEFGCFQRKLTYDDCVYCISIANSSLKLLKISQCTQNHNVTVFVRKTGSSARNCFCSIWSRYPQFAENIFNFI